MGKYGNKEICKFVNMEIWKYGNMEVWKYGNMEITQRGSSSNKIVNSAKDQISKINKYSISESYKFAWSMTIVENFKNNACASERHNHATSSSRFWKLLCESFQARANCFFVTKKKAIFCLFWSFAGNDGWNIWFNHLLIIQLFFRWQ